MELNDPQREEPSLSQGENPSPSKTEDPSLPGPDGADLPAEPQTGAPQSNPWSWVDVALMAGLIVLLFAGGAFLLRDVFRAAGSGIVQASLGLSIALAVLEAVAITGVVWLVGLKRRGLGWEAVGLRLPSGQWVVAALLLGAGVIPFAGLVALAVRTILGQADQNPLIPFLAPSGFSWLGFVSMLILGGLAAPFAEELFFRGVLYTWLRGRWGVWAAVIISSLIFGVLHGEPAQAIAAILMGVLMAWVFEKSRSLWPSVIIHATINSVNIALLYYVLARGLLPGS